MHKKKYLFAAMLALIWAMGLSAQSAENFDYTVGEALEGQSGGSGWSGEWVFRKGNDQVTIGEGGIAVAASGITTTNNHAATVHNAGDGGTRQFRLLNNPVTDDAPGTYYLSWVMDNQYTDPAANGSVHQVMLTNSVALAAGGPSGQRVRMGKLFGTEQFGIDGINSNGTFRIAGTNTQEAYWAVIKIQMSGNADVDTISYFINPVLDTDFATATPDLVTNPNLNDGFDAIGVKLEGGATLNGQIDEIRFSTDPADIVAPDLIISAANQFDQFNDYADGSSLDGADGGVGFGAPWRVVGGTAPTVLAGGIENYTILKETSGNRVSMPYVAGGGNSRIERPLNTTFQDDGSTYYFSYSQEGSFSDESGQVNYFMLIDTAAYQATGPGGQLVQIGKPLNTPFIGAGIGAANNFELTGASAADAHLVIVKVSTSGNSDPDTVRLFIDPGLEMEPASADATKLIGTNLNNGFNAVGFKVEGLSAGNEMIFDDVMVGLNYSDVIPPDLSDLEPLTGAFASDNFNTYGIGSNLNDQSGGNGWNGGWFSFRAEGDSALVSGQGLINNSLEIRTGSPSLRMTTINAVQRSFRVFENEIDTTDNAEFWFSVQLGMEATAVDNIGNFILADTSLAEGDFQQIIIGKAFGGRRFFATGNAQVGGNTFVDGQNFVDGTSKWVVGHMTRVDGMWSMDIFLDPDYTTGVAPDEATAAITNKMYNAGNFNAVGIRAAVNDGLDWLVDDIFFGDEFSDVIPLDFEVIPPVPPGATETFDYAAGDDYIGGNGGSGWAGPWTLLSAEGSGEITDEGVSSFDLLKATTAPRVELPNLHRAVRTLEGAYGDFGRDFWLGWWAQTENGAGNVAHLILADTATYAAGGPGGQLVQIGKLFGGSELGVVAAQGGTAAGVSTEDGHFIVAHIITNNSAENDQILLWVDPALDTEPDASTAAVDARADLRNWNALGFKFEGGLAETVASFDDIRLAGSFAEVVPNDLEDIIPPARPIAASDIFDYDAGTDLGGQDGGEGFAGPWTAVEGALPVGSGSIQSDRTCGEANHAALSQSGTDTPVTYTRTFFNPFGVIEEEANQVYVSFSLDVTNKDIGNNVLAGLIGTDGNNVISLGGVAGINDFAMIVNDNNPQTTSSASVLGAKWMVIRFDLSGDSGDDSAVVWLDPPADAIPADENALFTVTGLNANAGIAGIQLSGTGAQSATMLFDDFRIGFSYRDISCKFGSDDPDLFAYEPFNYDAGQSLVGLGGVNAFWDGVWEELVPIGDNNELNVIEGSIGEEPLVTSANRSEVGFFDEAGQIRIYRDLAFPLESDGRTYWLTFLMNTTEGEATNNVANITLRNSAISQNAGQRIAFGRMYGNGRFGFITPPNNQNRESEVMDEGLHWIVAKMVTTGGDSPVDTVYMWIDPPANNIEPDTADASFFRMSTTPFLKDGIDQLMLKAEGAGAGQTPYVSEFDEIRLATAWPSALVTGVIEPEEDDVFFLSAYPNPFGEELNVKFQADTPGRYDLELLDIQGRQVAKLFSGNVAVGEQQVRFNNSGLANGFYFLRVVHGNRSTVRKLILYR